MVDDKVNLDTRIMDRVIAGGAKPVHKKFY